MPSNIWLIALALFCSMSLDQLPPLLFTVPDPSLRLTCVNWFLFLPCHPFLALVVGAQGCFFGHLPFVKRLFLNCNRWMLFLTLFSLI
jgi:hypothetical protein